MSATAEALTDIEPDELEQDTAPEPDSREARNARRRERYAAKKGGNVRPTGPRRSTPQKRVGQRNLTSEIEALLELLAGVWMIRDDECGSVLMQQSHDIAAGLNAWAQRDPKVYAMLIRWLDGGGAGALAFAFWPLAMQVANHHIVPAIERRRELIAERQAAFDEQWIEPEPLVTEANVPSESAERFVPPNVIPDGQ